MKLLMSTDPAAMSHHRTNRRATALSLTALLLIVPISAAGAERSDFPAENVAYFEAKVRPLLSKHCYACHSGRAKTVKAGLRLDRRSLALKGGDSGAAVVPGKPGESLLMKAVRYQEPQMPPKGKLSNKEINALNEWIRIGAPWPDEQSAAEVSEPKTYDWARLRNEHWAFRPVKKPALPQVRDKSWPQNPIDHFILARLEAAGLKPAPPADPRTLIRRIYYDLVGLPPAPAEVDDFCQATVGNRARDQDAAPSILNPLYASRDLLARLLASPQYGQRWGRHWLDVARYADFDSGYYQPPHAWRYRDWVIDAFNRDVPYDRFVKLQIAGDLIAGQEGAVATGMFALGPTFRSDGDSPEGMLEAHAATLDDRIDTLSRGFLALTVYCARCHDHKFDPIPTLDYYSLAGVFNNTHMGAELDSKIIGEQTKAGLHVLAERGNEDMPVAVRGNLARRGEVAPRRFLRILAGADPPRFTQGSGRLELAQAVASADNPVTARVIVNRIWLHHFGRALVRTPGNFGARGEKPTHPKLLDWLAVELIESGWSIKRLHLMIMSSAAYQMSSRYDETGFRSDGDNRLVWRMNPRRLDAEGWRDTLLAVTGELDHRFGGPPIDHIHHSRRSVYLKVSRNGKDDLDQFASDEFLRLFDFPLMHASVAKRPTTVAPQQFLFLMNSRFIAERSAALAMRLAQEADSDEARIDLAYRILFGRLPKGREKLAGMTFLTQATAAPEGNMTPVQQYARVLLCSNELMYVR